MKNLVDSNRSDGGTTIGDPFLTSEGSSKRGSFPGWKPEEDFVEPTLTGTWSDQEELGEVNVRLSTDSSQTRNWTRRGDGTAKAWKFVLKIQTEGY